MKNPPEIFIVLDRLRSAYNVGNILRLADAVQAKEVIGCGYTPLPPHPKIPKSAMGAENMVKCRSVESSDAAVDLLRSEGVKQILAVEVTENSELFCNFDYQFPLALIFGNEALGVDSNTLEKCDGVVSLPMFGEKISINVGNCASAVLYSIIANEIRREGR